MALNRIFRQEQKGSETETKEIVHTEMVHRKWHNGKNTDRKLFVWWKKILTHGWQKYDDICIKIGTIFKYYMYF